MQWVLAGTLAGLLSLLAIWRAPLPYVWAGAIWAAALLFGLARAPRTWAKMLCLNLAVAVLVLTGYEGYLYWQSLRTRHDDEVRDERGEVVPRAEEHALLGYVPRRGRVHWSRRVAGELLFDVAYTIDENGLRRSPEPAPGVGECILFFGGSYTFGAGLEDEDTMAYRVGVGARERYRVYNFGFSGYGPHQMLAALESGLVDKIVECRPRYVLYQGIPDHVLRVAGKRQWDRQGPRYVVAADGGAEYAGSFAERRGRPVLGEIREQLEKSWVFRAITTRARRADAELLLAIVETTRDLVERRYTGCEFHVLSWDERGSRLSDLVVSGLRERGVRLHLMSDVLPRYAEDHAAYQISPHDVHPNSESQELLAEYVLREIVGQGGRGP